MSVEIVYRCDNCGISSITKNIYTCEVINREKKSEGNIDLCEKCKNHFFKSKKGYNLKEVPFDIFSKSA